MVISNVPWKRRPSVVVVESGGHFFPCSKSPEAGSFFLLGLPNHMTCPVWRIFHCYPHILRPHIRDDFYKGLGVSVTDEVVGCNTWDLETRRKNLSFAFQVWMKEKVCFHRKSCRKIRSRQALLYPSIVVRDKVFTQDRLELESPLCKRRWRVALLLDRGTSSGLPGVTDAG